MLGHEVDVFGLAAFGGHDQVAFVLAVFVIHEDDHLALADVFNQFFDAIERHKAPPSFELFEVAVLGQKAFGDGAAGGLFGGFVAQQQTLQITRQQVDFQIHPAARLV